VCGVCRSFLSDITCDDETGLGDLSSLYEMLSAGDATPQQPASVRKRRSLGTVYDLHVPSGPKNALDPRFM